MDLSSELSWNSEPTLHFKETLLCVMLARGTVSREGLEHFPEPGRPSLDRLQHLGDAAWHTLDSFQQKTMICFSFFPFPFFLLFFVFLFSI